MDGPKALKGVFDKGQLKYLISPGGDVILLKKFLGLGSFGAVFLAYHSRLKIDVAIKIFLFNKENSVRNFTHELIAYIQLSEYPLCHEHIVCLYDNFRVTIDIATEDGVFKQEIGVIASEFMAGGDLGTGLPNDSEIPIFIYSLLDAINFVHSFSLAHRDIKPNNILRTSKQDRIARFKLSDLGLVCGDNTEPLLWNCSYAGTVITMSPEALRNLGKPTSVQIQKIDDIWQLGVTFYALVFGKAPPIRGGWTKENIMKLNQAEVDAFINVNTPYPRTGTAVISGQVIVNIIASMLRINPLERPNAVTLFRVLKNNISNFDINMNNLSIYRYLQQIAADLAPKPKDQGTKAKINKALTYLQENKEYEPAYFLERYQEVEKELASRRDMSSTDKSRYQLLLFLLTPFLPPPEQMQI